MFPTAYYQPTYSSWETTDVERTQNFLDFPENGDDHVYGQMTPRGHPQDFVDLKTEVVSPVGGDAMRRQASNSSLRNRTIKASASKGRARLPAALGSQLPAYDVSSSAPVFQDVPNHAVLDMPAPFQDPTDGQMFYQQALSLGMHDSPVALVDPSQLDHSFDGLFVGSPETLDSLSSSAHSPRTTSVNDDVWATHSPTESHTSSPEIQGHPRMNQRTASRMSADSLQGGAIEDFSLPPAFSTRRQSTEGEAARDHPLYKNVILQNDGLYHCPWEGRPGCTHKAEKLKCNYDKFVDSHLKPYRCKIESCENAKFSSTACLLRHEREAHAMHGHGDKPYLCTYKGCDRAVSGNGFPRQWNLKDHMRRVHNDHGSSQGTVSPVAVSSKPSSKGRKKTQDIKASSVRKSAKTASGSDVHGSRRSRHSAAAAARQPLIDQWYEHHSALQQVVNGIAKPDTMDTLSAIKDAQDRIVQLGNLSHNLVYSHPGSRRSFTQESG